MRVPGYNVAGETLRNACNWIAPAIGFWTPAILARSGNVGDLTKDSSFFSRPKIGLIDAGIARRLHEWSLAILDQELNSIGPHIVNQSSQEAVLKVLPEVVSILALKVSEADLQKSFSSALNYYKNPAIRSSHVLHDVCKDWFLRLFSAAEVPLLLDWVPELLKTPLFDQNQFSERIGNDRWAPDPAMGF